MTLIFAGAHKVDANPYEALPKAVRADLQRRAITLEIVLLGGLLLLVLQRDRLHLELRARLVQGH